MAFEGQVSRLIGCLMFCGIFGGCRPSPPAKIAAIQVTGASMAPTIWGESIEVFCPACTIHWRANWQSELRPQRPFPCWNCGNSIDHSYFVGPEYSKSEPGEQIFVNGDAYRDLKPQINDIVAIGNSESLRIKRIIAIPGDVISNHEGKLRRNELPVVSDGPWILVHDDRHRKQDNSWWTFEESTRTHLWKKTSDGFRIAAASSDEAKESTLSLPPARLIYQHRSAYNGLRPDQVGDDYPANLNENRSLHPIDSLGLNTLLEVDEATELRFWLWMSTGSRCEMHLLQPGTHALHIRWHDSEPAPGAIGAEPTTLGMHQPICIEVPKGTLHIRHLQVERSIQYTIDVNRFDTIKLPLLLQADQYFVVGDNVPLSIDSRYEGPIHRSEIMGQVSTQKTQP